MTAANKIPDAVQKLAHNVVAVSKVASASTSRVLASVKPTFMQPGSPKRNKSEELANLFGDESSHDGFSSFIAAASSDSVPSGSLGTKKPAGAAVPPSSNLTKQKLLFMEKEKVAERAEALTKLLRQSKSSLSSAAVCNDVASHLTFYPEAVQYYSKFEIVPLLLKALHRCENGDDRQKHLVAARRCLALMGYAFPVKGPGVSVLSLDGGGMKGLALIEVLKQLEKAMGQPLHKSGCFDYVMGTSTGGIVALVVFLLKTPLSECEAMYLDFGTQMFSRDAVTGTSQLLLNQAFYDSQLWEQILKNRMEGATFADYAGDPTVPKVSILSSVAGESANLMPFLFRNYNPPTSKMAMSSPYPLLFGSSKYKLWQGCRASSAAPFYYDEFKLDGLVHMDGGLIANNPTAYALHEASMLWPNERTNCVVSLGTGRFAETWLPMVPSRLNASNTPKKQEPVSTKDIGKKSLNDLAKSPSLRQKITSIVEAATDSETTHAIMAGMLSNDRYFRLNPFLSQSINLDESRPENLARVQADAQRYAELNDVKFRSLAKKLKTSRPCIRRLMDAVRFKLVASTPLMPSFPVLSSIFTDRSSPSFESKLKQKFRLLDGGSLQSKFPESFTPVKR